MPRQAAAYPTEHSPGDAHMEDRHSLEDALALTERSATTAIDSASRCLAALKRAQHAAKSGDLAALKKAMADGRDLLRAAQADATALAQSWAFSEDEERRLFADGAFARELIEAGERQNLVITELDGLLMSYPVIVRTEPAKSAVTIDRKLFRRVRPAVLARHLADLQQKPGGFRPAPFIESLYKAWEYARRHDAGDKPLAGDVRVDNVWAVLTVAPGSAGDYPRQEFGRDLYLLERSEVRATRSGARVHFSRSTGTKARGAIVVVGEDGRRVTYSSIGFTTP